jgi:hypothetical protein
MKAVSAIFGLDLWIIVSAFFTLFVLALINVFSRPTEIATQVVRKDLQSNEFHMRPCQP